uniref:Uncharacterized protein n=1 Tax=uncultured Desulfobacterales bacterium HF0200_07G10 TaxID=710741 RepID=E0XU43_9BACT|nr:hypothetical protein [uncultured Desulfobacterales bacterium HF0200_07G10]
MVGFGNLVRPLAHPEPYLHMLFYARLVLKLFRGEPAIAGFDWPFTPIHNSSKLFSTSTGSGLHEVLPSLHPGHG